MADNQEVMDAIAEQTVAAVQGNVEPLMAGFTADDLAKARAQEKAKLYPQIEKMQKELDIAKALAEELAAKDIKREEERDSIVPQLIDLVNGSSQEDIEQSIETLKAKSAGIMQDVQQATMNAKQSMAGTRITAPASGPLDNDSEHNPLTIDPSKGISMDDYIKNRHKYLGAAANNRGQGLFG